MKLVSQFLCIFLFALSFSTCSLLPDELQKVEQLIENTPDSALHILQGVSPSHYKSDANRALYGLLLIRTLDKKQLPLKPDSLLNFAISYYQRKPDKSRLASCYLYKGRSLKYAFQYEKAMEYYLKAGDEAKDSSDQVLLGRITMDCGEIYSLQKDYANARTKFYQSYLHFSKAKQQMYAFYALLSLGETFHYAREYKRAEKYYRQLLTRAKDSLQRGSLYQDMGLNFYKAGATDSALHYFRTILPYPYLKNNKALRYYYLADVYFDLQQLDAAAHSATTALHFQPDIRTKKGCYRILANVAGQKANLAEVSRYMTLYQDCNDSIRTIDAQTKGSYIATVHQSKQEAVTSKSRANYLYIALFVFASLSAVVIVRIVQRNKKDKLQTQQKQLEQKAQMHTQVLLNYRKALQEKIQERKAAQSVERKKANLEAKHLLDRKVYEELLHINDTEFFYNEMNSVLNHLISKIQNRYPALTTREIMWCCLLLLKIPTTDIYLLLDTNVDSLKKMKQRLAPKFNLSLVSEMEQFLINLISE